MDCLMKAWHENEQALKNWLIKSTSDGDKAEDILQDIFLKALKHKERFCSLDNSKSWLFTIARNSLIDQQRKPKLEVSSESALAEPTLEEKSQSILLELQTCMTRVLSELDNNDREAIEFCDINGMNQNEFAKRKGLSLPAAKSRIQRARSRLRSGMVAKCQIQFDETGVCGFTPRK